MQPALESLDDKLQPLVRRSNYLESYVAHDVELKRAVESLSIAQEISGADFSWENWEKNYQTYTRDFIREHQERYMHLYVGTWTERLQRQAKEYFVPRRVLANIPIVNLLKAYLAGMHLTTDTEGPIDEAERTRGYCVSGLVGGGVFIGSLATSSNIFSPDTSFIVSAGASFAVGTVIDVIHTMQYADPKRNELREEFNTYVRPKLSESSRVILEACRLAYKKNTPIAVEETLAPLLSATN